MAVKSFSWRSGGIDRLSLIQVLCKRLQLINLSFCGLMVAMAMSFPDDIGPQHSSHPLALVFYLLLSYISSHLFSAF